MEGRGKHRPKPCNRAAPGTTEIAWLSTTQEPSARSRDRYTVAEVVEVVADLDSCETYMGPPDHPATWDRHQALQPYKDTELTASANSVRATSNRSARCSAQPEEVELAKHIESRPRHPARSRLKSPCSGSAVSRGLAKTAGGKPATGGVTGQIHQPRMFLDLENNLGLIHAKWEKFDYTKG